MPTVIGFRTTEGAVLAADRLAIAGDRVRSRDRERVFTVDDWVLAVAEGDVNQVRDRLDVAVESYATDHGQPPAIDPLERLAAEVASDLDATLVVAGRDANGEATVVAVRPDGSRLRESPVALGDGAALAMGQLESADPDQSLDSAKTFARDVLETVAGRDTKTGEEIDVGTLANG